MWFFMNVSVTRPLQGTDKDIIRKCLMRAKKTLYLQMSHDGKTSTISKSYWLFCGLWTPFLEKKATFQLQVRERKIQSFFLAKHQRTLCWTSQTHSLNLWELLGVLSPVRCILGWDDRGKSKECICLVIWLSDIHIHIDIYTTVKQADRPTVSVLSNANNSAYFCFWHASDMDRAKVLCVHAVMGISHSL